MTELGHFNSNNQKVPYLIFSYFRRKKVFVINFEPNEIQIHSLLIDPKRSNILEYFVAKIQQPRLSIFLGSLKEA